MKSVACWLPLSCPQGGSFPSVLSFNIGRASLQTHRPGRSEWEAVGRSRPEPPRHAYVQRVKVSVVFSRANEEGKPVFFPRDCHTGLNLFLEYRDACCDTRARKLVHAKQTLL